MYGSIANIANAKFYNIQGSGNGGVLIVDSGGNGGFVIDSCTFDTIYGNTGGLIYDSSNCKTSVYTK
jgi:hypothetical protein